MADKSSGVSAFHDWLSASAYVKGGDQTARVVSKKKRRPKSNSGLSENKQLEAEEQMRVLWKLSNRHYRRWMNDRLLRELAPPLDAQEIGSLFAPPPWGEKNAPGPFERVSDHGVSWDGDRAAWEPFRNNVDMDIEAKVLQHSGRQQGKALNSDLQRKIAAVKAWQSVSHRSRDVLRRSSSWHLVGLFEERILEYLKEVEMGGVHCLTMNIEEAYHRMLIHGICEFHGLSSKTVSDIEEEQGIGRPNLLVKIKGKTLRARNTGEYEQASSMSLLQFLMDANRTHSMASGA